MSLTPTIVAVGSPRERLRPADDSPSAAAERERERVSANNRQSASRRKWDSKLLQLRKSSASPGSPFSVTPRGRNFSSWLMMERSPSPRPSPQAYHYAQVWSDVLPIPKGLYHLAQGWRVARLPWVAWAMVIQPQRGCIPACGCASTLSGLMEFLGLSQGSSSLATLG